MGITSQPYYNEKNQSLCKWQIKITDQEGVIKTLPALDPYWCLKTEFETYVCLLSSYGHMKTGAALDEWLYKTNHFQKNMEQLLALRHNEFWSTMLYNKRAISSIVSFLQRATPFYRIVSVSEKNCSVATAQYEQLLSLVVRVVFRLLTSRESATAWMTPVQHGDLLYNNFLLSVPMLFDLTIALGNNDPNNTNLLKKLFSAVLSIQPKYQNDIQCSLKYFETTFARIQTQVDNEGFAGAGGGADLEEDGQTPYDDVVFYTLDCAYTLSVLWEVCPQILLDCVNLKLPQSIANFYDNTLPHLYKYIHTLNPNADSLLWLNEARQQFLNAFRSMTKFFLETALQSPMSKTAHKLVELLTECLSAQSFVVDYQRQYPVEFDMEILQQACEEIKDHKIAFIVSGYEKALSTDSTGTVGDYYARDYHNANNIDSDEEELTTDLIATMNSESVPAAIIRDIDLDVSKVLDVLPDLGIGFVRRLLERYDNSEQAIAAILDNNLPPDLTNCDRNVAFIPPDPQDLVYEQTGLRHINVHDGDAYDVMTQDNPECIIKQGKGFPGAAINAEQLLDDKDHLKSMKERYQQYALVEETIDEYDDEYDDSYDAMIEGQPQPLHKSKELRSTLSEASCRISESEESDDNEDMQPAQQRDKRNDFCENPEVVRARYMARQQAIRGLKGIQSNQDVVGAAKGHGQNAETLRNRGKKEANKASRANHNRKSGAAFKRSKGMVP